MQLLSTSSRRNRKGFTLIELLVVVAIITTLIAMLLPALNQARSVAQSVVCATTMRQFALASQMYANDHHGANPNTTKSVNANDSSMSYSEKSRHWYAKALFGGGYLGSDGIGERQLRTMACPVYVKTKGLYDWLIEADGTIHESWPQWFSFNYAMVYTNGGPGESDLADFEDAVFNVHAVPEPAGFMFIADYHALGPHEQRSLYARDAWMSEYGGEVAIHNSWRWWDVPVGPEPHNGNLNAIMYDGHNESLSYAAVRQNAYHVLSP